MRRRWVAGGAAAVALSACNAILDNDPRSWDPDAAEGGAPSSGTAGALARGGSAGKAGASGKGGVSGRGGAGGNTSGRGGTASSGRGGTPAGEAGASAGTAAGGGGAPIAGEGGRGDAGGAAGNPACECTPGATEDNVEPCGDCLSGTMIRTKTCLADCSWGPFGDFGECTGVTAICSPGTPGSQTVPCPCGGTKSQGRTCTEACDWSGWSDTSSCDLECCSEVVFCNTPDDISPASRGTWCRETQSACTNDEVNADCYADVAVVCDALVPELYIEYR